MKRKLIPDVPEPLVLTEELEKKLQGWIAFFRNISPRVLVKTPQDNDFDLTKYENACKLCLGYSDNPKDIILCDWPKLKQVAFIVCYDSATPGNKPEFLAQNAVMFCFKDFAFGFGHNSFEQGERTAVVDQSFAMEYNLFGNKESFTWKFNKELIQYYLLDIENSVSKVPTK